ncbi:hypothetical protein FBR05_05425 [Deltaproteobacteria bacterium PRO3]|nr:hypothetical protein [Deltaproteobacteria bacterium PRO3]
MRKTLGSVWEEGPPPNISALHARWLELAFEIGQCDAERLEDLRCRILREITGQGARSFRLIYEVIAVDLMILVAAHERRAPFSDQGGDRRRRWIRCCLNDLEAACEEVPRNRDAYSRIIEVMALTRSFLHLEFLCPEYPLDLALQGLKVRRGLERLAYDTIDEVSALGLRDRRLGASYVAEASRDLKVIYHQALDAGKFATLSLLESREGLGRVLELSCAAASLSGEASVCSTAEGVFRFLESAELYARLGLEARVSGCLEQARKSTPALPAKERSAVYLRIEQIQQQPLNHVLGASE